MKTVLHPLLFLSAYLVAAHVPCAAQDRIPKGARKLGYTKCIIHETPTTKDIAPGANGAFKWFSGQWFVKSPPSLDHYTMTDGVLTLRPGGYLVSAPRDFSKGALPLLPGKHGFYVEFDVRLSSDDPDHWPALWLMPAEHNGKKEDCYPGDPPGFGRWMELDVDEGGFGPGLTGSVHSWTGIYPNYKSEKNKGHISKIPLRRKREITFGASYDPNQSKVTWWVDGKEQHSATSPYVPNVAKRQNFYLIISANTHGKKIPYSMFVRGVRAYTLPEADIPGA